MLTPAAQAGQYAVFYDASGVCFGSAVILQSLPGEDYPLTP